MNREQLNLNGDLERRLLEYGEQLSPAERRASEQLLASYDDLPFLTADTIASTSKTSASTVVRLVSKLGYSSYMELQAEAQSKLKQRLSSLERVRRIGRKSTTDSAGKHYESPSLERDIDLLFQFAENVNLEMIRQAASLIVNARAVLIVAFRASAPLAYYLHLGLMQLLGPKMRLASDAMVLPEQLSMLDERDALLAISFPRYSTSTIRAAEIARRRQSSSVIAITNSVLSPLAANASIVLTCPFVGGAFQNSPIASYALVHVLVEEIIRQLGPSEHQQMEQQLSDAEELLTGWGLWSEVDGGQNNKP